MTILDVIIIAVTGLAVYFDLKVRKIPNWLIMFGLAAGVTLNLYQGTGQLTSSLLGFVVGIATLFIPFAFGWIGAGDVKFFAVLGALLGVGLLPRVFFYSAIFAGLIAVGYTIAGHFNFAFFKNAWAEIRLAIMSMGQVLPDTMGKRVAAKESRFVPWGVAFTAGTFMAYYIDPNGKWAGF